jgi:hypothetical protein
MQVKNVTYEKSAGWSASLPTELDSEQTLVLVFGGSAYIDDASPFDELARAFPKAKRLGCSSAGEIAGATILDEALAVAVVRFDHTRLAVHVAPARATESFAAGQMLAKGLQAPNLRGTLVLSDGLQVNGSELVAGLNSVLPESVVVTGGLAGDGDRFKRTWVLDGTGPKSGVIVALGLYGDRVQMRHGSKGGWDKFGPERAVTKSVGNVLWELDRKPALALYKEYLGERASGLPATGLLFPLAIRKDATDDKSLVRTILGVNEADQTMTFAGDVPEGYLAQLMTANFERLISGASDAAMMAGGQDTDAETLAIAISCVGRRLVLGERAEEELEATLAALPKHTTQVGFYSYGELSPYATGRCDLHNQTMTLTLLSEP